jgi:CRISPR-associated protein Csm3
MPDLPRWSSGQRPEPEPKPFGKVGLRGKARRSITPHDRFSNEYTGDLRCTLVATTPIHIGSGIYDLDGENVVRGLMTHGGNPIIPGTSLKGAIRSIAEAISDSCIRVTRRDIANNLEVKDARPCDDLKAGESKAKLCVCCSIFGALGYQGRVSFDDARLVRGGVAVHTIQSPYPPRESARSYKNAYRQFNGRKFYYHGEPVPSQKGEPYHVVDKNSELEFSMRFESLTAEELCLVMVAMGIPDDIVIKVGGGKQAMLGSVELFLNSADLQKPASSFEDLAGGRQIIAGDEIKNFIDEIGKASKLIHESSLDELIKIWEHPTSRKAPTGLY